MKYGRARYGLKKVHVIYPKASNIISLCRRCSFLDPASEDDFKKNPCSFCLKLVPFLRQSSD